MCQRGASKTLKHLVWSSVSACPILSLISMYYRLLTPNHESVQNGVITVFKQNHGVTGMYSEMYSHLACNITVSKEKKKTFYREFQTGSTLRIFEPRD